MPPCQREHQCHCTIRPHATGAPISPHDVCARASGSTDFTVLYAPVLAGALISQLHQEHRFRHAICACAAGAPIASFHHSVRRTIFVMPYAAQREHHNLSVLAGALIAPFWQDHQFCHVICARARGNTSKCETIHS